MPSDEVERRLAAVLSADVVGYTRLMAEDDVATLRTLGSYREQVAVLVRHHGGRVVDDPGDNLLAEFPAATNAAHCAVEIQRVMRTRNAALSEARRMDFRIGLHLGEVIVEGERIYGDGVNIASRLEGLAEAGGIACSAVLRDQLRNAHDFDDLGEQRLRNVARPVRVYRLRVEPDAATRAATPDRPSIAVLPFANMSGDPEQEYFADGISEDLITALARLSGLIVIARTSAFTYKHKSVRVEQIGRELGVRYVLEGSVRRVGSRVRITAQLVDAASGHHLWSERYDRSLDDIFRVQDEVSVDIASTLRVQLDEGERERGERFPTQNREAYDLYLRAMSYFLRFSREGIARARELLERALELDPRFALALAALAGTYTIEAVWAWTPASGMERAVELARRALELDPSEPGCHLALARIDWFSGRHEQSLAGARAALALRPGDATALTVISQSLRALGRLAEAREPIEAALRLDPHNWYTRFERGALLYSLGSPEDAELDILRTVRQVPDFVPGHLLLAACYAALGREVDAHAEIGEMLRLAPGLSIAELDSRVRATPPGRAGERFRQDLRRAGLPDR